MWGNLLGWMIAGVLLVLIGTGTWFVSGVNVPTSITKLARTPGTLDPLTLEIAPASIVPTPAPGDAGPLYRQAIDDVKQNRKRYERFVDSGKLSDAASFKAIQPILDAAPLASMSLLADTPQTCIGYFDNATPPDLASLELAGKTVERVGLFHLANKNLPEARKHFEAEFALGAKMFNERVIFMEAFHGIGLMRGASEMLRQIAASEKNEDRARRLQDFDQALGRLYAQRLEPMWKIINAVDDRVIAAHTGDIFYFSSPAMQERMWRVESTLKLGRFRFNVGGPSGRLADQQGAIVRLEEIRRFDPDPLLQTAAKAALSLTLPEFRLIK